MRWSALLPGVEPSAVPSRQRRRTARGMVVGGTYSRVRQSIWRTLRCACKQMP